MNFIDYLADSAQKINQLLEEYLTEEIEKSSKISKTLTSLVQTFAEQAKGGKRLRATLVRLGYELINPKYNNEILKPALAFEIFQTAILAHDDVIDLSPLRRGKMTMYKALGGDHHAMSQTICLGDTGFFLALELIGNTKFADNLKLKALSNFNNSMLKTAAGQMLDIEAPKKILKEDQDDNREKDALEIARLKTAQYTVVGPMQLGSILAGADDQYLDKIKKFGEGLGIAFQIQDDILGVFGTEEQLGKSVTSDVKEGKNTLLISYALTKLKEEDKLFLLNHYGKGSISKNDFNKIKNLFESSGALDYSRKIALEYVSLAKETIPLLTKDQQMVGLLNQMADFLIERTK